MLAWLGRTIVISGTILVQAEVAAATIEVMDVLKCQFRISRLTGPFVTLGRIKIDAITLPFISTEQDLIESLNEVVAKYDNIEITIVP